MNTVKEKKIAVRQDILQKRRLLEPSLKREMDNRICNYILSLATYRYSDTVLFYYPLKGEIDVTPALMRAWSDKKTVLLPRCRKDKSGIMEFYIVNSVDELEEGAFGVMEPKESCPLFPKENCRDSAICIMPALTFDRSGYRLGYGKGYYDRYLQKFRGIKIGLVYSDFMYDRIPRGYYDVKADIIITEKGVISLNDK